MSRDDLITSALGRFVKVGGLVGRVGGVVAGIAPHQHGLEIHLRNHALVAAVTEKTLRHQEIRPQALCAGEAMEEARRFRRRYKEPLPKQETEYLDEVLELARTRDCDLVLLDLCLPPGGTVVIRDPVGEFWSTLESTANTGAVVVFAYEANSLEDDGTRVAKNAIVNTPPGGEITIQARTVDSQVEVSVQDNGMGISAEHLPYVFERFYRADQSRARSTGGAGLGLAIVKQLVEAQGGQVAIDSQVDAGTRVSFTSPIADLQSS